MKTKATLLLLFFSTTILADNGLHLGKKKILVMGDIPNACVTFLQKEKHKLFTKKKEPLTYQTLFEKDIVVIAHYKKDFSEEEVEAISGFVNEGGVLILAAQAWSWSYKVYENKPNNKFPFNVLGVKLGFNISSDLAGTPVTFDDKYFSKIKVVDLKGGIPSPIIIAENKDATILMSDINNKNVGVLVRHGLGVVYIFGHEYFLRNKKIVKEVIKNKAE